MKRAAILFCAAAIAGCSSLPTDDKAAHVPTDRVFNVALLHRASPDDGRIAFFRDWGIGGGGCSENLYVDGKLSLVIEVNEQAVIYLPPGHHFFRVEHRTVLCPSLQASQETTVEPGSAQTYRIQLPAAQGLLLTRIR